MSKGNNLRFAVAGVSVALGLFTSLVWDARTARADLVWDIDPAVSSITLTIPDQNVSVPGIGTVNVRIRNADNSAWSQGRTAALDGTLSTEFIDGASIDFNGGAHNAFALESGSFRPNPAVWNGSTWTNTSAAPAAFAGKVRGVLVITVDVGYFAMRSVFADIESNIIPLGGGGAFAASSTSVGLESAQIQLDGLSVLGNDIPDLNEPLGGFLAANTAGAGSVTSPNPVGQPLLRKLTLPVNVPLAIPIEDVGTVTGTITGNVVAYAMVPEPGTLALACLGLLGIGAMGLRRR